MGGRIQCFVAEPTDGFVRSLRRFQFSTSASPCPSPRGYHNACAVIDEIERPGFEFDGDGSPDWPREDSRWPPRCDCGYAFTEADEWQVNTDRMYRRADGTGFRFPIRDAPAGAMWFAPFYDRLFVPQLEHCVMVMTPGGEWCIDSMAKNCTIPDDLRQGRHHCWVIEGTLPNISVSKNGPTCGAGAGSIKCGSYHGFLRNGFLEEC